MPSSIVAGRAGRLGLGLLGVLAGAALVLALLYAGLPWLVSALAPRLAAPLGLDELGVRVGRPGWHTLSIEALELEAGRVRLTATRGSAGYRMGDLLGGRLESIHFEDVRVHVGPAETAPVAGAVALDVDALIAAVPVRRLDLESLTLQVPGAGFRGRGSLRLSDGDLRAQLAGLAPPAAERLALDLHRDRAGTLSVRMRERDGDGAPILLLTFETAGGRGTLGGEVSLDGYAFELGAAVAGLPAGRGSVQGSFSAAMPWPLPDPWSAAAITGAGKLTGTWEPRDGGFRVAVTAAQGELRGGEVSGESRGRYLQGEQVAEWQVRAEHLDLSAAYGGGQLVLAMPEQADPVIDVSWSLTPDDVALTGVYRVSDPLLRWLPAEDPAGRGTLSGRLAARMPRPLAPAWQDRSFTADGSVGGSWDVEIGKLEVHELDGRWRLDQMRLSANFRALVARAGLAVAANVDVDVAELTDSVVHVGGTATLGDTVRVPVTLRHDVERRSGTLTAHAELTVEEPLARTVVHGWDASYDVTGGTARVDVALRWPGEDGLEGEVRLDLESIDAHFRDYRAAGMTSTLTFSAGDGGSWRLAPAALSIRRVDTGVELEEVETGVGWSGDTITLEATRARMLGGSVGTMPFAYAIAEGRADFVLDLAGIDLARVLALEGDHVSGTGILNGSLPVELRDNVPEVVAGHVAAEPPGGVIRLAPTLVRRSGQPGLDFALRALEDFRYSSLEADVGYSGAGDLTVAVRLQGRNPDVEGGRPIHYNVTVTENVPTLLRSLRLQDEVTREIERRVTD